MPDTSEKVTPSRVGLAAIVSVGMGIGVLPYLMFVGRPQWALYYFAASILLAAFMTRKEGSRKATRPGLGEWLLAAWAAVWTGAGAGAIALAWHGIICGSARLLMSAGFIERGPVPEDGKAVTSWSNRDEALADVASGIRRVAEEIAVGSRAG